MSSGRIESFDELPLSFGLLRGIRSKGWHSPSEYQKQEMKKILTSKCLLTVARTGMGQTTAVMIAAAHEVLIEGPPFQSIILVHNRETAMFIGADLQRITKHLRSKFPRFTKPNHEVISPNEQESQPQLKVQTIFGGVSVGDQIKLLKENKPQILSCTPGRLTDMVKRGCITFENLKFFAIEGLQDCLEVGFQEMIEELLRCVPTHARKIVTSYADIPENVGPVFNKLLPDLEKSIFEHSQPLNHTTTLKQYQYFKQVPDFRTALLKEIGKLASVLLAKHNVSDISVTGPHACANLSVIQHLQAQLQWCFLQVSGRISIRPLSPTPDKLGTSVLFSFYPVDSDQALKHLSNETLVINVITLAGMQEAQKVGKSSRVELKSIEEYLSDLPK